jgi:flagellar biosynthetic protein FliQ
MGTADVTNILRDAVYTVIIASAPMLIVAMVIGLVISIFQATTQINEQTLAYAPKVVAILLALVFFSNSIMTRIGDYTRTLFDSINTIIR